MQNFAVRFVDVSNARDIVENQKNKSTKRITDSHYRLLSNWLRTNKRISRNEPSCGHDKVSESYNTTFGIGSFMPNQLNRPTTTKPKQSKFKFLNRVINDNITIKMNTSSTTVMDYAL